MDATLAGAEVGMARFELTPIELVGDDRALAMLRWHNGDGFELEWLLVTEVDADGRILRLMNFDVDDRDAASAALHEWATDTPQMSARRLEASSVRMDTLHQGDRRCGAHHLHGRLRPRGPASGHQLRLVEPRGLISTRCSPATTSDSATGPSPRSRPSVTTSHWASSA